MQKAYAQVGRELAQVKMNVDGGHPEIDDILTMMDVNGDGHISLEEVEGTLKELCKLFGYKIDN